MKNDPGNQFLVSDMLKNLAGMRFSEIFVFTLTFWYAVLLYIHDMKNMTKEDGECMKQRVRCKQKRKISASRSISGNI